MGDRRTLKLLSIPPLFAAVTLALSQSAYLMKRPDAIYVPVVLEAVLFVVGYLVSGVINAAIVVPVCLAVTRFLRHWFAGVVLALVLAALGTWLCFHFELYGAKRSVLHSSFLFGVFLPLFLMTMACHHLAANRPGTPPPAGSA